jgi:hypothetical protein
VTAPTLPLAVDHGSASDTRSANEILRDESVWEDLAKPLTGEETAPESPRNEKGQFVKRDEAGEQPDQGEAPVAAPEVDSEVAAPAEASESEAEPAPEAPKPERAKATQFQVYDDQGEVELPEVLIEFKAHGETRKMPLDKVVRLAQSGFYNEQLQSEVKSSRTESAEIKTEFASLKDAHERQVAFNRALMENGDEFFLQQRETYLQQNSPEQRNRRLEAQLHRERGERERMQWATQAQSFLQGDLEPKVSALLAEYSSVTDIEAAGFLAPYLKTLEVNGVIPPQRYGEVARLLESDLPEWMGHLHFQRTETTKQSNAKRTVELRQAQAETAKAKRDLTKVASPARSPGAVTAPPPSSKPNPKLSAKEEAALMWKRLGVEEPD